VLRYYLDLRLSFLNRLVYSTVLGISRRLSRSQRVAYPVLRDGGWSSLQSRVDPSRSRATCATIPHTSGPWSKVKRKTATVAACAPARCRCRVRCWLDTITVQPGSEAIQGRRPNTSALSRLHSDRDLGPPLAWETMVQGPATQPRTQTGQLLNLDLDLDLVHSLSLPAHRLGSRHSSGQRSASKRRPTPHLLARYWYCSSRMELVIGSCRPFAWP
jgi:hypothetical protein